MPAPRMPGNNGLTEAEQEVMWNLHVTHKLPAKTIARRFGMGQKKVDNFLRKRREERGVKVKIDHFRIERPL